LTGDNVKQFIVLVVVMFVIATFFIIGNRYEAKQIRKENNEEVRAIYFSYLELEEYIKGKGKEEAQKAINNVISNLSKDNFNVLILHVRPFSDSIYSSKIFPNSTSVTSGELPFDILAFFIEKAHAKGIKVHAWVNPYRISSQTDLSIIKSNHPAYDFLKTNNIKVIDDKGIYYNPASEEVKKLIIAGIEEIVTNYEIDGIHFDDYFYPSSDIDESNYQDYVKNGGKLKLLDYHLENVLDLIKRVNIAIKKIKPSVLFGIAPEGNIPNNYSHNYLDVKKILASDDYIDYIMPQLYYGFNNEAKSFVEAIGEWNDLIKVDSIKLIPALALYKSGKVDKYAKGGSNEWIERNDIIKRQIVYGRGISNYEGFALFRYAFFYNPNKMNDNLKNEVSEIKKIMSQY